MREYEKNNDERKKKNKKYESVKKNEKQK